MKVNKPSSFHMTSYEQLFKNAGISIGLVDKQIREIPIEELHAFKGHTYQVRDDESMEELIHSIKDKGILIPGICRQKPDGGFEIVSGHRRTHAAQKAGLTVVPMIVMDYTDDQAIEVMVDSNLQREEALPSEKAKSYRAKHDAAKRQKKKNVVGTLAEISQQTGENFKQVQRYIWLSRLIDPLLEMVDNKKLGLIPGVDISFLSEKEQEWVLEVITGKRVSVSKDMAAGLKTLSKAGTLTKREVQQILTSKAPKEKKFGINAERLNQYFDKKDSKEVIEETIFQLLDEWKKRGGN